MKGHTRNESRTHSHLMACSGGIPQLSHRLVDSLAFRFTAKALTMSFPVSSTEQAFHTVLTCPASLSASDDDVFPWDDVVRLSKPETLSDDLSDVSRYWKRSNSAIADWNRNLSSFVGYIHKGFAEHLRSFKDVLTFPPENSNSNGNSITLHSSLSTAEDRTRAVGDVIKSLGAEHFPGIRNEVYGVHMSGCVEKGGKKFLWIGKRSRQKPTYPGMLDHLVAGGLPHGVACGENVVKECEEEAGIPRSISSIAIPVTVVSYLDIDGWRNGELQVDLCDGCCKHLTKDTIFQTKLLSFHH